MEKKTPLPEKEGLGKIFIEDEAPETPDNFTRNQRLALKAYKAKNCNVTKACDAIGLSRPAFYNWYNNIPAFKKAVDAIYDCIDDVVIESLMFLIKGQYVWRKDEKGNIMIDAEGEPIRDYINPIDGPRVQFYAETKMKDKGFKKSADLNIESNQFGGFEINVKRPEKKSDDK